jgi:hypothetical protein
MGQTPIRQRLAARRFTSENEGSEAEQSMALG